MSLSLDPMAPLKEGDGLEQGKGNGAGQALGPLCPQRQAWHCLETFSVAWVPGTMGTRGDVYCYGLVGRSQECTGQPLTTKNCLAPNGNT